MAAIEELDDLLISSILTRLPPKSVFKFKCVSKKWRSIIANPLFLKSYSARKPNQRLLGFIEVFYPVKKSAKLSPITQTNMLMPREFVSFIHSSNGLVLCYERPRYYIVNPMTNARFVIPQRQFKLWQMGLSCNENMNELAPSFKVIGFLSDDTRRDRPKKKTVVIGTYSTTTHDWKTSKLSGPNEKFRLKVFHPNMFVFNGVFHWCADDNILAVYDSKGKENYIQLIKEPPRSEGFRNFTLTRSSKDDVMWVGRHSNLDIKLWKLPKDDEHGSYRRSTTIPENEWILVYKISKDYRMPEELLLPNTFLRLEALIIDNAIVAILSIDGRAFICDIEKKSVKLIDCPLSGGFYSLLPYMEPCLSSYALSDRIH